MFEDNFAYIKQHNREAELGLHTFTLGVNQFADWTNDEFRKYVGSGGFIKGPESLKVTPFDAGFYDPDALDWRSHVRGLDCVT